MRGELKQAESAKTAGGKKTEASESYAANKMRIKLAVGGRESAKERSGRDGSGKNADNEEEPLTTCAVWRKLTGLLGV
jgi:hypothetical protein